MQPQPSLRGSANAFWMHLHLSSHHPALVPAAPQKFSGLALHVASSLAEAAKSDLEAARKKALEKEKALVSPRPARAAGLGGPSPASVWMCACWVHARWLKAYACTCLRCNVARGWVGGGAGLQLCADRGQLLRLPPAL
jgi:hypothetical protein